MDYIFQIPDHITYIEDGLYKAGALGSVFCLSALRFCVFVLHGSWRLHRLITIVCIMLVCLMFSGNVSIHFFLAMPMNLRLQEYSFSRR